MDSGDRNNRTSRTTSHNKQFKNNAIVCRSNFPKDVGVKNRQNSQDQSPKSKNYGKVLNVKKSNSRSSKRNSLIRNEVIDWTNTNNSESLSEEGNEKQILKDYELALSLNEGKPKISKKKFNKKVNINHLINCTYDSIKPKSKFQDFIKSQGHLQKINTSYTKQYKKLPKINHVRTHCQTILRKGSISTPSIKELNQDINMYINWDDNIACLQFYQDFSDKHACAICLSDTPTSPRSTRCGHVFCFPCILHHFSVVLTDDETNEISRKRVSWRKCPICHKEILKRKLKPARIISTLNKPQIGKFVDFHLITRCKNSNFGSLDVNEGQNLENNMEVNLCESMFAWINLEKEKLLLNEDLNALKNGLIYGEKSEIPFFLEAIEIVNFEIEHFSGKFEKFESGENLVKVDSVVDQVDDFENFGQNFVQYYQSKNSRMFLHPITKRLITDQFTKNHQKQPIDLPEEPSDDEIDKLIKEAIAKLNNQEIESKPQIESKTLSNLPKTITGKVVDIDNIQIHEDIQKRFKFLNHLPIGTTVQLVELAIGSIRTVNYVEKDDSNKPPAKSSQKVLFDKSILNNIRPALNKRKHQRQQRAKLEKTYETFVNQTDQIEELYNYTDTNFPSYQTEFDGNSFKTNENENLTPVENSFGFASEMRIEKQVKNMPSFGLAAKMQKSETSKSSLGKSSNFDCNKSVESQWVKPKSGVNSTSENNQLEHQECFVHIKSKSKDKKKNKNKKKRNGNSFQK